MGSVHRKAEESALSKDVSLVMWPACVGKNKKRGIRIILFWESSIDHQAESRQMGYQTLQEATHSNNGRPAILTSETWLRMGCPVISCLALLRTSSCRTAFSQFLGRRVKPSF